VTPATVQSKTSAIAAFLGDSGLYRQIESNCCMDDTFLGLNAVFGCQFSALAVDFAGEGPTQGWPCEKLPNRSSKSQQDNKNLTPARMAAGVSDATM
jgi:hypothetical protein